jgi:hypothetical protein
VALFFEVLIGTQKLKIMAEEQRSGQPAHSVGQNTDLGGKSGMKGNQGTLGKKDQDGQVPITDQQTGMQGGRNGNNMTDDGGDESER